MSEITISLGAERYRIDLEAPEAKGGEGLVFFRGKHAIKIYQDLNKFRENKMLLKVVALEQALQHPYIVAPQGVVMASNKLPIGIFMEKVEGAIHLAQLITKPGRDRYGFTDADAIQLAERMREIMLFAHSKNVLLVDPNEYAFFVLKTAKGYEPRVIDVDSWVPPGFKPSVVSPLIQDYQSNTFNKGTDWYSLAITIFQLLVGIHPFAGGLDGFAHGDYKARMLANASVFSKGIRLPKRGVRDFSLIPEVLLEWLKDVLQHGKRTEMPSLYAKPRPKGPIVKNLNADYLIRLPLYDGTADPATKIFPCDLALTKSNKIIKLSNNKVIGTAKSQATEVIRRGDYYLTGTPITRIEKGRPVTKLEFSAIHEDKVNKTFNEESLNFDSQGTLVRNGNNLFIASGQGLTELNLRVNSPLLLEAGKNSDFGNFSTQWLDAGIGVQTKMGQKYLILPVEGKVLYFRVEELDGLNTIVTARAGHRLVVIIGKNYKNECFRVEVTLKSDLSGLREHKPITITQVPDENLSLVILPRGLGITIPKDGELTSYTLGSGDGGSITNVTDPKLKTSMALSYTENLVLLNNNGSITAISIKKA